MVVMQCNEISLVQSPLEGGFVSPLAIQVTAKTIQLGASNALKMKVSHPS